MSDSTTDSPALRVMIVGGGPAGCACALSLVRQAERMGRRVKVTLFEHKSFGTHYNQCMGVLSPPIEQIMHDCLALSLPGELIQRKVKGYWLHTDRRSIYLTDSSSADPELSLVTRRVFLDGYLLAKVESAGVDIFSTRVNDIEFNSDRMNLYAESGSFEGDVLVGAFGLDRQMCEALKRKTGYRPPDFLETVVTKMHPGQELVDSFGDQIHAFLPRRKEIEFAALVPKGDHITAIAAGRKVTSLTLREFLASPVCSSVLKFPYRIEDIFKGCFPISRAKNFYGNRYITVGDSAGLVRPFKGKGINVAILSGYFAARNILERGISRAALSQIEKDCDEQIGDLWYGRTARWTTSYLSRFSGLDPVLKVAENDQNLRQALFDSVSAHDSYRNIFKRIFSSPQLILKLAGAYGSHLLKNNFRRDTARKSK